VQATFLCVCRRLSARCRQCGSHVSVYVGVCQRGVVSVQATSLCVCRRVSARCFQCASDVSVCM